MSISHRAWMHRLRPAVIAPLMIAVGAMVCCYCGLDAGTCFDVAWTAASLSATIGTLAARRRARPESRARWTIWSLAAASWLFGQAMWDVYGVLGFPSDPNLADLGWWGFALLVMLGVLRVPRAQRSVLAAIAMDALPLICAAISLCIALLFSAAEHSGLALAPKLSDLTYPCLYATATILVVQAMLGGALRGLRGRPSLRLFLGGNAAICAAFILWSGQLLQGSYVPGRSVLDPLWVLGLGAIGIGGLMTAETPEPPPVLEEPGYLGVLLPAAMFVGLFVALLVATVTGAAHREVVTLVLGLLCSGAALIARSTLLSRRTRELLHRERAALAVIVDREAELARLNSQLVEDSRHDALTGIRNRRALSDDLPMYRSLQRDGKTEIGVLVCDIDHFKSYNDRFGHLAGDQALSMIAATARGVLGAQDAAYRFGGEELLLILRNSSPQAARFTAESLRAGVERAAFAHPLSAAGVLTVSIGFASGVESPEELLARADSALYRAKDAGRNCVMEATADSTIGRPVRPRQVESEAPAPRHLRSMLALSRAAASGQGEMPVLQALADTIRSELFFNVVVVNRREPEDQFRAVVVLGDASARETLLGTTMPLGEWEDLTRLAHDVHGASWLPAGSYPTDGGSPTWRAATVPPLTRDGWDPEDMLLLPLRSGTRELLGFVSVDQPVLGRRPTDAEISVLMAVVDHAGLALERVEQLGEVRGDGSDELRLAAVMLLAEALDLRDPRTALHSRTVGRLARRAAAALGLPESQVERIHAAGVLHDLGKLGISDAILQRPGALDEAAWREIRQHPEVGARILEHAGMRDIAGWVRAHHERIDGAGYPHGLAGAEISLEARILSVADSYEAMIADRAYRSGMAPDDARQELLRCAGTQFDPEVVAAFLRALDSDQADGGLSESIAVAREVLERPPAVPRR